MASHGINRMPQYVSLVRSGDLDPRAAPIAVEKGPCQVLIDGRRAIGIVAMQLAVERLVQMVGRYGIAQAGIVNCGHTGRMGSYGEMLAKQGIVSIAFGGGARKEWPQVVPYGGTKAIMATNPFTFGAPLRETAPLVADFAISKIAFGKARNARDAGRALPEGAAIDAAGQPTRDAAALMAGGALLPFGEAKGSGMGLFSELLGGALFEGHSGLNWLLTAFSATAFGAAAHYENEAAAFRDAVKAVPAADPQSPVMLPGEIEARRRDSAEAEGLEIDPAILARVVALGEELGIAL